MRRIDLAALRQLSEHYAFGATLDAMLHDRLVCGIYDNRILRRLLSKKDLTFGTSLEIAKGMESAQKDAVKHLSVSAINRSNSSKNPCLRCIGSPLTAISEITQAFGTKREDTTHVCMA